MKYQETTNRQCEPPHRHRSRSNTHTHTETRTHTFKSYLRACDRDSNNVWRYHAAEHGQMNEKWRKRKEKKKRNPTEILRRWLWYWYTHTHAHRHRHTHGHVNARLQIQAQKICTIRSIVVTLLIHWLECERGFPSVTCVLCANCRTPVARHADPTTCTAFGRSYSSSSYWCVFVCVC